MATETEYLKLFKYHPETDSENVFSIHQALNMNWDKIDAFAESAGRNIGEIVTSTIPLTNAGLHLLDGSLLQGSGIYREFVDYIADIYKTKDRVYNPEKLTIVGNPNITNDGIISGITTENFVKVVLDTPITNNVNFKIRGKFYNSLPYSTTDRFILGIDAWGNNIGQSRLGGIFTNLSGGSANLSPPSRWENKWLNYVLEYESNGDFTITLFNSQDKTDFIFKSGVATNSFSYDTIYLGVMNNQGKYPFNGEMDLKELAIEINGQEIASGSTPANYFCTENEWQTSVTTYGVCGKFVYDRVNNTIRLPRITGIVEGTTDVRVLGDLTEAGLPNITGTFFGQNPNSTEFEFNGAFYRTPTPNNKSGLGSTDNDNVQTGFDASLSNPIYGNSATVQPQTIKVLYYIVIANSTKTEIEVDIDEIATDLNGKADVSGSNITSQFTTGVVNNMSNNANIYMSCLSMPGTIYDNLTLGASGTEYTAPATGWYALSRSGGSGKWMRFENLTRLYGIQCNDGTSNSMTIFPVSKGDVIRISYEYGNVQEFRFLYSTGSESEAN